MKDQDEAGQEEDEQEPTRLTSHLRTQGGKGEKKKEREGEGGRIVGVGEAIVFEVVAFGTLEASKRSQYISLRASSESDEFRGSRRWRESLPEILKGVTQKVGRGDRVVEERLIFVLSLFSFPETTSFQSVVAFKR